MTVTLETTADAADRIRYCIERSIHPTPRELADWFPSLVPQPERPDPRQMEPGEPLNLLVHFAMQWEDSMGWSEYPELAGHMMAKLHEQGVNYLLKQDYRPDHVDLVLTFLPIPSYSATSKTEKLTGVTPQHALARAVAFVAQERVDG